MIGTQTLNYSNATAQYSNVSDANNYIKTIDISNGENGGIITNYSLPELNSANASVTINKAILTVKAANESIIFSQSDPLFTAIYSGFKNGENITALSGAASFTRATGTDAGDYNIMYNGNLSAVNYTIVSEASTFTIHPADTLLIRVTPRDGVAGYVTYGNNPLVTNTNSGGTHQITAVYLNNSLEPVFISDDISINSISLRIRIYENDVEAINFILKSDGAIGDYSSSGALKVGAYNFVANSITKTSANFTNVAVTGAYQVQAKEINVGESLTIDTLTKTYDGDNRVNGIAINNSSLIGIRSDDAVLATAVGTYDDKHVGIDKVVTISIGFNGADASNYKFINNTYSESNGVISQLDSVTWTGNGGVLNQQWTNRDNWQNGAVADRKAGSLTPNVANVIIPTGYTAEYNVDGFSGVEDNSNSNLTVNGTILFNSSSAFNLSETVSGAGTIKQTGSNILTISGNNINFTGLANVGSSEIIVGHNNALGLAPSVISAAGKLSYGNGIVTPSLTVNGNINIKSDITTTGAQIYNNDVKIITDTTNNDLVDNETFDPITLEPVRTPLNIDWKTFSTDGADITFNGRLYADQTTKADGGGNYYGSTVATHYASLPVNNDNNPMTSVKLKTCATGNICDAGSVTFNGNSGFSFVYMGQTKPEGLAGNLENYNLYKNVNLNENLYRLDVAASQININSNIMTTEEQIYRSPVVVGGNKINYLVSLDPNVTFLENISDANPGTNSLIVRAVEISPPSDTIAAIAYKAAPTNLLLWDPLAFGLELGVVDSSSNLQIGDYREIGTLNNSWGTIGGIYYGNQTASPDLISRYTPTTTSSSVSDRSADLLNALVKAGNRGDLMEFFKNLQFGEQSQNQIILKSIEILTGSDIDTDCSDNNKDAAQCR